MARVIDAAGNRTREALRVLEDLARFALDNPDLTGRLKNLRHDVTEALARLPLDAGVLLAWRDTPGDVGTGLSTAGEMARSGPGEIAAAAGGRLSEALRSLEESTKAFGAAGAEAARQLESARYRAYDAVRAVQLALGSGRRRQWRLCVIITESLCHHHPWRVVAERALHAGADCLQLREKQIEDRALVGRARVLIEMARPLGAVVVVNDRPDLALLAAADGVHVGQTDLEVLDVRKLAGFQLLVGVSTGTIDQARRAAADGADVCGVGPMFPTTTKHKPVLAGSAYLREYLGEPSCARVPHLAIGGITPANIAELVEAGCQGVAVSASVCGVGPDDDPAEPCAALLAALDAGRAGQTLPDAAPK